MPAPAILMANTMALLVPARFRTEAGRRFVRPRVRQQSDTGRDFLESLDASWIEGPKGRQRLYSGGSGPLVLFQHGWEADAADLSSHAQCLFETGWRVAILDGPAHGASEGHTASIVEFAHGLGAAAATLGQPFAMVGHSMGAASGVVAMSEGLLAPKAFVGLASPCTMAGNIEWQASRLGMSGRAIALLKEGVSYRLGEPLDRFDVTRDAPHLSASALFLHGDNDVIIPDSAGREAAAGWPGAQLAILPGIGHRGILRDPEVLTRVSTFLEQARGS